MLLHCSVLGKDVEITDMTVPVISPYWRLKRNGNWTVLCRYEHEQIEYSMLSPPVGATLSLMDGRLTFRHLAMIVQYANGFESLESARAFLVQVISAVNRECDAIVMMTSEIEQYVKKMDPAAFTANNVQWREQKRPAVPIALNVMFSNDCETNCTFCHVQRRYVPENQLLPTKRWLEILAEAKVLGIEQVTLSGGDPLLRRDALALIAELVKLDMLFLLSTKCYITDEIADRLVEIGMTRPINQYIRVVELRMDGPDEQIADKVAGSTNYGRALQSIKNLLSRGFNTRVKAVVTPLNAPHIYRWIRQLTEEGVTQITVAGYQGSSHQHEDTLLLSPEDRIAVAKQCEQARMDFPHLEIRIEGVEEGSRAALLPGQRAGVGRAEGSPIEHEMSVRIRRCKERAQCSGGRSSMTIAPDGKVVLCDTDPQDEAFFVGDVAHQSILEVWNSKELDEFAYPSREKFKGSACYACEEWEECRSNFGYCFRETFLKYGTIFAPPPTCPMAQEDEGRE